MPYYLATYNASGAQITRFSDFLELQSHREVNGISFIAFSVNADHPAIASLDHLSLIKLYRSNPSIPWYTENFGFIISRKWIQNPTQGRLLSCIAVHPNWLLSTRHVAWSAGTIDRSKFTAAKAETIAKTLVTYNITSAATVAAGRLRAGNNTAFPVTVQADGATGATLSWYCAYKNLLTTLQDLAAIGGGDFDMVASGSNYEFRWHLGQLGTDRSTTIFFSTDRGNIANPVYDMNRQDEKTIAIVGGQGEGIDRMIEIRQSTAYSTTNDLEAFVYSANIETAAGLDNAGDEYLQKHTWTPITSYNILQTPGTLYGLHYFLGDQVTARNPFTLVNSILKVQVVDILLSGEYKEKINIQLGMFDKWPNEHTPIITSAHPVYNNFIQSAITIEQANLATIAALFLKLDASNDPITGPLKITPSTDGTGIFQVFKANGTTPIFTIDTTNERVGVGVLSPTHTLHLSGQTPAIIATTPGTAADDGIYIGATPGGDTSIATTGVGGIGSDAQFLGGTGGKADSAATQSTGGVGGRIYTLAGTGGAAIISGTTRVGGAGGAYYIQAGLGGAASGGTNNTGGIGGHVYIYAGKGGPGTPDGSGGYITFYTSPNNSAHTARMRILATGEVGIGNTAPATKLHVEGGITIDGDDGGHAGGVSLTNVTSGVSTGIGVVLCAGTTARNSSGWMKIFVGTAIRYIPYWTTIT